MWARSIPRTGVVRLAFLGGEALDSANNAADELASRRPVILGNVREDLSQIASRSR